MGIKSTDPAFSAAKKSSNIVEKKKDWSTIHCVSLVFCVAVAVEIIRHHAYFSQYVRIFEQFQPISADRREYPFGGGDEIPVSVFADPVAKSFAHEYYPETTPADRRTPYFATWKECPFAWEKIDHDINLYLLHDVVSDNQIERLKALAQNKFEQSFDGGEARPDLRKSSSFINNYKHNISIANEIDNLLSQLLGMPKNRLENLQVVHYKKGGFFKNHTDQIRPIGLPRFYANNPRSWTAVIYMNTPITGGGTQFPNIGITVPAVKGDMALWFNSKPDSGTGYFHEKTLHAGEPVGEGEKWIVNFFTRHKPYRLYYKRNPSSNAPMHCNAIRAIDNLLNAVTGQYYAVKVKNGETYLAATANEILSYEWANLPFFLRNGHMVYFQFNVPTRETPGNDRQVFYTRKFLSLTDDSKWAFNLNFTDNSSYACQDEPGVLIESNWMSYDENSQKFRVNEQLTVDCFMT